jgi:hypothetical protein
MVVTFLGGYVEGNNTVRPDAKKPELSACGIFCRLRRWTDSVQHGFVCVAWLWAQNTGAKRTQLCTGDLALPLERDAARF